MWVCSNVLAKERKTSENFREKRKLRMPCCANTGCLDYEQNSEIRVIREWCSVGVNARGRGLCLTCHRSNRIDMTQTENSETMKL